MTKLFYVSYIQGKVSWLSVVVPAFNPSTPRQKLVQFKASLDYAVSSRSVRTAYWNYLKEKITKWIHKQKEKMSQQ